MSGVDIDSIHYRNDRALARIERARLQPLIEEAFEEAIDAQEAFDALPAKEQGAAIRAYMTRYPMQLGLFGEAVNEHALAKDIAKAFYANDTELLGRLVDRAFREYLSGVVASDTEDA